MSNPYLDDSDDDLLKEADKKTAKTSGAGISDNIRVEVVGMNGQMPAELQAALANYFAGYMISPTAGDAVPLILRAIPSTYEYLTEITRWRENGPLLNAVADLLNEMTEGRLLLIYQLKEAERKIHSTHKVKKYINFFLTGEATQDAQEFQAEIQSYFKSMGSIVNFVQSRAVNLYYDLCAKLGREPDEGLV